MCMYACQFASVVSDSFVTPWTVACQAPLSTEFSRPGYWDGLPFPSPGDLPWPGIKSSSPALAGRFFTTEPLWIATIIDYKQIKEDWIILLGDGGKVIWEKALTAERTFKLDLKCYNNIFEHFLYTRHFKIYFFHMIFSTTIWSWYYYYYSILQVRKTQNSEQLGNIARSLQLISGIGIHTQVWIDPQSRHWSLL